MNIPPALVDSLLQKYPHARPLVEAFVPLLEARETLAQELPTSTLPDPQPEALAQGRAWLPPVAGGKGTKVTGTTEATGTTEDGEEGEAGEATKATGIGGAERAGGATKATGIGGAERAGGAEALYLDEAFMARAPQCLLDAARKGMPQLGEALDALGLLFRQNPKACHDLALLGLVGKRHRTAYWAKKHGQDKAVSALLCLHLAGAAARRVAVAAQAAQKSLLEKWTHGHCPVCGGPAHAGFLQHKEGQRFVQCGLCGQVWRFSRTTCPICADDAPDGRTVFFYEGDAQARAEACESCKSYMLVPDMRDMAEKMPLELLLLCLMPLDMHMQEKGYTPASLVGR